MSALKVDFVGFEELKEDEKKEQGVSNEDGTYLRVKHNGKTILLRSDDMAPEDACFGRDLSWVDEAIELAYKLGLEDGRKETKT